MPGGRLRFASAFDAKSGVLILLAFRDTISDMISGTCEIMLQYKGCQCKLPKVIIPKHDFETIQDHRRQAVDIKKDDLEADCSSYQCSTVPHLPLDMIDPSLAIGFYCRDKEDFEDFCSRATQLADKSDGAPLFTIVQNLRPSKPISHNDSCAVGTDDFCSKFFSGIDDQSQEEEWQIL